ncbi:NAD(P)-dependent oxidoreductase [Daejeonella sp.]|uniref:NAD(P)-dependent oxidoreductase n=1 Tax=Daejeonella sp. TaxID=2805397 RepID=UPI0030C1ACD4
MKVTAYSIKAAEKEFLTKANCNRHDITLTADALSTETVSHAKGKNAVLVFTSDDLSEQILKDLKQIGVKYIITRSTGTDHIDLAAAKLLGLEVASIPSYSPESVAEHAITLMLALCRNILPAHQQMMEYDFRLDALVGTTIRNKTVGVVGFGKTGQALVRILSGFGCDILVSDFNNVEQECSVAGATQVSLDVLYEKADIISFHVPLTQQSRHMVNSESIAKMKDEVMLINVSRGAIFNSIDVYNALQRDKISRVGMDVYEFENHIFFFDHSHDIVDDQLLKSFIQHSRCLLTPHQAFLTKEALQIISERTIKLLDAWEAVKPPEVSETVLV